MSDTLLKSKEDDNFTDLKKANESSKGADVQDLCRQKLSCKAEVDSRQKRLEELKNDMEKKELKYLHGLIKTIQRGFGRFIDCGQVVQKNTASLKEFRGTNEEIKEKKEELLSSIEAMEEWESHILLLFYSFDVSVMRFPSDNNTRIMGSFRDSVTMFPSYNNTRFMNGARHTLTDLSEVISPIEKFAEDEYKSIDDDSIKKFGVYLETVKDIERQMQQECREKVSCKAEVDSRQKRLEKLKNDMESKELIHEHGLIKTIQSGFELFIDWGQVVQDSIALLEEFRGTEEEIKKKKEELLSSIKTMEKWESHILQVLRSFTSPDIRFSSDNNSRIMDDAEHTLGRLSAEIPPIKEFAEDKCNERGYHLNYSIERFGDDLETVKDIERQMQQELRKLSSSKSSHFLDDSSSDLDPKNEQTKIKHVSTEILDSNNDDDVCESLKSIEIESEESRKYSWCDLIEEEEMATLTPTEMLSKATNLSKNYPDDHDRACHYLFAAVITTIAQFFARGGCDLSTRDYEKRGKCLAIIAGTIVSDGNFYNFFTAYTLLDHFLEAYDMVNYNMGEYVENIQKFVSKLENACDDDVKKVVEKVLSDKPVEITDLEETFKRRISGVQKYNPIIFKNKAKATYSANDIVSCCEYWWGAANCVIKKAALRGGAVFYTHNAKRKIVEQIINKMGTENPMIAFELRMAWTFLESCHKHFMELNIVKKFQMKDNKGHLQTFIEYVDSCNSAYMTDVVKQLKNGCVEGNGMKTLKEGNGMKTLRKTFCGVTKEVTVLFW